MRIKRIVPACMVALPVLVGRYTEEKLSVTADFTLTVEDDDYSVPSRMLPENKSARADSYRWTFEGGEPSGSTGKQPGAVTYSKAGAYAIRLEAWNDDEHKVKEFVPQLDSAVTIGFNVAIPINDISPVQAVITNTTVIGGAYRWTFEGGTPAASDLRRPEPVTFTTEGEHKITPRVSNGRERFTYSKTITVKPAMSLDFDKHDAPGEDNPAEAFLKQLIVYPNPNNGQFTVRVELNEKADIRLRLVNMIGATIDDRSVNGSDRYEVAYNLAGNQRGTYILRLISSKANSTIKVVITP